MSDTHVVAKIVLVMGLIFTVVGLIFPGQDAAWTNVRTTLSHGPSLPTFNNPLVSQATVGTTPRANGAGSAIESVTGCLIASYWQCIASNTATAYLTINATISSSGLGGYFNVAMTNVSGNAVTGATVTVWCRSIGTPTIQLDNVRPGPVVVRGGSLATVCNPGSDFLPIKIAVSFPNAGFPIAPSVWNNFDHGITLVAGNASQKVQIAFIQTDVQVDLGGAGSCPSAWDMGCQLSRLVDPIVKFFLLIGNAIYFGVAYIVAILGFIANVVVGLFLGLFTTFAFLLAIPGAPPVVQGLVAVLVVGMGAMLLIILLKQFTAMIGGMKPL